jgi:hypothetical protein
MSDIAYHIAQYLESNSDDAMEVLQNLNQNDAIASTIQTIQIMIENNIIMATDHNFYNRLRILSNNFLDQDAYIV